MLKKLEKIGEVLKSNILYDFTNSVDTFLFIKSYLIKDHEIKRKITKSLNRKITADDQL